MRQLVILFIFTGFFCDRSPAQEVPPTVSPVTNPSNSKPTVAVPPSDPVKPNDTANSDNKPPAKNAPIRVDQLRPVLPVKPLPVGDGQAIHPTNLKKLQSMTNPKNPEEKVWFDTRLRRVMVKGAFCLPRGTLEYLIVASGGKSHESVVEIKCVPLDLAYAMLACGYPYSNEFALEKDSTGRDMRKYMGQAVDIYFEYQQDGVWKRRKANAFVQNGKTNTLMKDIPYIFTGSRYARDPGTGQRYFKANFERNIASVFFDMSSLLNTPLNTGIDDTYYFINEKTIPPKDTPVTVIFQPAPKNTFSVSDELTDNGTNPLIADSVTPFHEKGAKGNPIILPHPQQNDSTPVKVNPEDELDVLLKNLDKKNSE